MIYFLGAIFLIHTILSIILILFYCIEKSIRSQHDEWMCKRISMGWSIMDIITVIIFWSLFLCHKLRPFLTKTRIMPKP